MPDRDAATTQDDLTRCLGDYRPILDEACAAACGDALDSGDWSVDELRRGYEELWQLSEGKDLAYDRPSIGLHYALWYHLQRTQTLVRVLAPLLRGCQNPITIHDIGCGTGATAWAAAIVYAAMRDTGEQMPRIYVLGTDTSPFMLDMGNRLWRELCKQLSIDRKLYKAVHDDWAATSRFRDSEPTSDGLIICSWLINATDVEDKYLAQIESCLTKAVAGHAERMLLLSSPGKEPIVDKLSKSPNWSRDHPGEPISALWKGTTHKVAEVRGRLLDKIGKVSPKEPSWMPSSEPSMRLLRRHGEHIPGLADRVKIEFNDEQNAAAKPAERLTALVGAAGSGKSLVICERVARVVEQASASEAPRILVTSFNKAMVDQLADWTEERIKRSELQLVVERHKSEEGFHNFDILKGDTKATIHFLNRDKLPTRVWQRGSGYRNPFTRKASYEADLQPSVKYLPHFSEFCLDLDFLERELELVLLGQEALDFNRYTDPDLTRRSGRKVGLSRNQRVKVWRALEATLNCNQGSVPFIWRRIQSYLYNKSRIEGGEQMKLMTDYCDLTHVFVDEAQDMTRADLKMLARTPPRPQRLFIAGDSAQALHTGGTSPRPSIEGAAWNILTLPGSYRLPSLVCKALQPLAKQVIDSQEVRNDEPGQQGLIPEVQRFAVPGPRPVIVDGSHPDEVVKAMRTMSCFASSSDKISNTWHAVHEKGSPDPIFSRGHYSSFIHKQISLLRTKGLEFSLVFFQTNTQPPKDEAEKEWLYAALTRAKSVLMIAVCEPTNEAVTEALKLLNPDELMFWDDHARDAWNHLVAM
ncbi:MAG: UvrD-helicase domain-containing protein [Acidimicrobiaceae bacterium]|nr:UvrD-helicase domain-containing protein [Acidimicrobiaceae bacterium]